MQVDIQDLSEVEKIVSVRVSAGEVAKEREKTLRRFQAESQIKGFRPGKVPFAILEKHYGESISHELKRHLVDKHTSKILTERGFVPLVEPIVQRAELEDGKDFAFEMRLSIRPTLAVSESHYKGLVLSHPDFSATDEECAREVEALRERAGNLEPMPAETPLGPESVGIVDFEGSIDGKPFSGGKGENQVVELGKKRLLPDFEAALCGLKAGGEKTFSLVFPEDYFSQAIRGKEAVFKVKLHEVKCKVLPALDDEFAKDMGDYDSLAALQEAVRKRIGEEKQRAYRGKFYDQIVDHLIANVPCPLPQTLVEREKAASDRPKEDAEKRLKADIILQEIGRLEKLSVEVSDIEARIMQIAMGARKKPQEVLAYYQEHRLLPQLHMQILLEKTLEKILEYGQLKLEAKK